MLIVFDLDFTIWDAGGTWCDQTSPPYSLAGKNIEDSEGSVIYLYPDVMDILETLSEKGITLALASRTYSPENAGKLMDLFGIRSFFKYEEIYPSSKIRHFESLQSRTHIPYKQMYFFDDEHRNISEVGSLGVHAIHVSYGLSWRELKAVPGFT